ATTQLWARRCAGCGVWQGAARDAGEAQGIPSVAPNWDCNAGDYLLYRGPSFIPGRMPTPATTPVPAAAGRNTTLRGGQDSRAALRQGSSASSGQGRGRHASGQDTLSVIVRAALHGLGPRCARPDVTAPQADARIADPGSKDSNARGDTPRP